VGFSAASVRRLSVALEQLLDPLDLSVSGDTSGSRDPSGSGGARGATRSVGRRRRGRERLAVGGAGKDPDGRSRRDRPFARLANAVRTLRWRQANAVIRLRWSHPTGYRVAKVAITAIAIVAGSYCVGIVVVFLTAMR
jgi:hypothetical protein